MEITRETVNQWLEEQRRSRDWLAEKCGTSLSNVGMWLNKKGDPREIPGDHKITIRALMEEDAAKSAAKPPHNLVLEFDDAQYSPIEQAALAARETVREWAKRTLNDAAGMNVQEFASTLVPIDKVAEDPVPYRFTPRESVLVPLLRAAAGSPMLADAEMIEHHASLGDGRFFLELRGESMLPVFHDGQRIVMRSKDSLRRPVLKYGEFYAFVHQGELTFKQWAKNNGDKILHSLNPEFPDLPVDESIDWIGWYDAKDNK